MYISGLNMTYKKLLHFKCIIKTGLSVEIIIEHVIYPYLNYQLMPSDRGCRNAFQDTYDYYGIN